MSPRAHPGEKIKNFCVQSWDGSWTEIRDVITCFLSPLFLFQESRTSHINKISSNFVCHLSAFYRELFEFSCPCGLGKTGAIFLTNNDSARY